jgi:multiple sugar transport system permease protein
MRDIKKSRKAMIYIVLTLVAIVMIFPFLWMVSSSLKTGAEVYSLSLIPEKFNFNNYIEVFQISNFGRWFLNSFCVSGITVISVLFFDSLVGYTFAKLEFRGRNFLFMVLLSTMMIPTEMLIIPWFMMTNTFQWTNTFWSLVFPNLSTALGVFLMRQFFSGIPNDLLDAGRVDGLSEFGIYWKIALPLVKPALSALAILTFLMTWNAFLWPVIALDDPNMYTLPVGIAQFSGEMINRWDMIMTGASIATIPVIIIFLIFQKKIIEGVQLSGVKG